MRSEIVERMRGIYVIVDPEHTNNRNVIEVAEAAFNGGAATVQPVSYTHLTLPTILLV